MFRQLDPHHLASMRALGHQDPIVGVVFNHAEACIFGNLQVSLGGIAPDNPLFGEIAEELDAFNQHAASEFLPKLKQMWRHLETYGLCIVQMRRFSDLSLDPDDGDAKNAPPATPSTDSGPICTFEVLDPADYRIKYTRTAENTYEFEVFQMPHPDSDWTKPGSLSETPLSDIRVFTTPTAMQSAPFPRSTLLSIRPHIIAYQRYTVFIFMILQAIASPDWSVHVDEKPAAPKEDNFISFPSIDGAHGGRSTELRAAEQATTLIQQQVAVDAARNQFHARHRDSWRNLATMASGSPLVDPVDIQKVPIWASVPPFVTSGELHEFNRPSMPTNLDEIKQQLLDDIGAPFGLSHTMLRGDVRRKGHPGQPSATIEEGRIKRYASLQQARIAEIFQACLDEMHHEFLADLREKHMATQRRRRLLHPQFQYASIGFKVQIYKTPEHNYEDLHRLFDDGIIDFDTFAAMARSAYDITAPVATLPQKRENKGVPREETDGPHERKSRKHKRKH